jgi:hypothetical protein
MSLVLQSSGGGSVTIQEPNTASNFTQDLPAVDGTILTSASQSIPSAALPIGSVLQVVSVSVQDSTSTISTSFTNTTITASITPSSSSSKIFCIVNFIFVANGSGSDGGGNVRLDRSGTTVYDGDNNALYIKASSASPEVYVPACITKLDSPATTSALTYTLQVAKSSAGGAVDAGVRGGNDAVITLMEIAG